MLPDARGAEAVDRLGVVADDRDAAPLGLEPEQDVGLERVRVLVLVDEDVIEERADARRERLVAHEVVPVEEEIVVVEHRPCRLGVDVRGEEVAELLLPLEAPGEARSPGPRAGVPGCSRRSSRSRGRSPFAGSVDRCARDRSVTEPIDEVGGVLAIEERERGIEPDRRGVVTQEPVGDGVEGPRPREGSCRTRRSSRRVARRVISCAARREKVSSRTRRGSAPRAMSAATRWTSVCVLPGPRAGDDQKRSFVRGRGSALSAVQSL